MWQGSLLKYLCCSLSTHVMTLPVLELAQIQPLMTGVWCF